LGVVGRELLDLEDDVGLSAEQLVVVDLPAVEVDVVVLGQLQGLPVEVRQPANGVDPGNDAFCAAGTTDQRSAVRWWARVWRVERP
jgi:hypothetical protein